MNKKVESNPYWSRTDNGVLVNSNISEYQNYLKRRQMEESKDAKIASLSETINNMSRQIDELKKLVLKSIEDN